MAGILKGFSHHLTCWIYTSCTSRYIQMSHQYYTASTRWSDFPNMLLLLVLLCLYVIFFIDQLKSNCTPKWWSVWVSRVGERFHVLFSTQMTMSLIGCTHTSARECAVGFENVRQRPSHLLLGNPMGPVFFFLHSPLSQITVLETKIRMVPC